MVKSAHRDTAWFSELLSSETVSDYELANRNARFSPQGIPQKATSKVTAFVLLAVVGIGFGTIAALVNKTEPALDATRNQLMSRVQELSTRIDDLESSTKRLRSSNQRLTNLSLDTVNKQLLRDRKTALAAAGLGGLKGPGFVLTLIETGGRDEPTDLVMDSDLMIIVNGLWSAGAKAVEINGQPISGVTSIRNAGSAVLVDYQPVTSPFRIKAIGSGNLERRFEQSDAWVWLEDLESNYPISVEIKSWATVKIAAGGVPSLESAVRIDQ